MAAERGNITRRMALILDKLEREFASLCDLKDFKAKLDALKKAENKSDYPSKLKMLYDMFDICGIKYERGKSIKYYEDLVYSSVISDFSGVEDRMLLALYNRFDEYPTPEDYMKRIVDRLCAEEDGWQDDTLRLRILKQFIKYGNYLSDAGFGGRNAIRDFVKKSTKIKNPTDEEVLIHLDDSVFLALKTADRSQRKPEGKYGLLKAADDLAAGKFRTGGATRKSLYLFAMAYGMTYSLDGTVDTMTDIETNLFRDYYANNLMRFISETYKGNLSEFEINPSGQGINYKNFAEMIYLYYISKDCSPQEKIKLSSEMIARVQDSQFKHGHIDMDKDGMTLFCRALFMNGGMGLYSEDILDSNDSDFEKFICENYDCDTYAGSYELKGISIDSKTNVLQLETEQNSALREYRNIIADLNELGVSPESCDYGLWFTDVAAFTKKGYENICDRNPDIDRDKFGEFMEMLAAVDSFMKFAPDADLRADAVTRTSMIVAYYYYYNALHADDGDDKWKSFREVFNDFKGHIDPKLDCAFYQPLSGKNIFDVLVVFSSYAYVNI